MIKSLSEQQPGASVLAYIQDAIAVLHNWESNPNRFLQLCGEYSADLGGIDEILHIAIDASVIFTEYAMKQDGSSFNRKKAITEFAEDVFDRLSIGQEPFTKDYLHMAQSSIDSATNA